MERSGVAELPLHAGKCPRWLFSRMVLLARGIARAVVQEYGTSELLRRLSDPFWFQALGNVLGFDWHSSGVTTTVCGALKEALNRERELGIRVAGGKGRASRRAPEEIRKLGEELGLRDKDIGNLIRTSRMSAKVDSAAVQDGYELYHHAIIFDERGKWCVVQQGMNTTSRYARRYHWVFERTQRRGFVDEPHTAICAERKGERVLDLTSRENKEVRKACVDLLREGKSRVVRWSVMCARNSLLNYAHEIRRQESCLKMPADHFHIPLSQSSVKLLERLAELQPSKFEEILEVKGAGATTLRALALTSQLIYGTEISWKDPAKFSFAHGGKDNVPYPVNRKSMERTARLLEDAIRNAELGKGEKKLALMRLARWCERVELGEG